jgi:hypothetical protein
VVSNSRSNCADLPLSFSSARSEGPASIRTRTTKRIGDRRLFILLREQSEPSDNKRIDRLYRDEALMVRRRKSRRSVIGTLTPIGTRPSAACIN